MNDRIKLKRLLIQIINTELINCFDLPHQGREKFLTELENCFVDVFNDYNITINDNIIKDNIIYEKWSQVNRGLLLMQIMRKVDSVLKECTSKEEAQEIEGELKALINNWFVKEVKRL